MVAQTSLIEDFIWMQKATEFLHIQSKPFIAVMKRGQIDLIAIDFVVQPGYFIMADKGTDQSLLYTRITAHADHGIHVGPARFSRPEQQKVPGLPGFTEVFRNTISVKIPVTVREDATPGLHYVEGSVFYQAGDAMECFFPSELKFHVKLRVL